MKEYSFIEGIFYGVGAGAGFTLAITIMAGIREELDVADVPKPFQGAPITLIIAGILALAFMGFTGMISYSLILDFFESSTGKLEKYNFRRINYGYIH